MSLLAPWDFYFRAFRSPGSPRAPAGYNYGAKLRIAPAGLSPASTTASLAAPSSSELSLLCCPGLPSSLRRVTRCVLFSVPSASALAIGSSGDPWHHHHPANQLHAGTHFDASSVRFRYGPPACSPPALTGPAGLYVPASPLGLLLPGFQVTRSPRMPAGYNYDAKLRIASAGLSPASTAASLAAPGRGVLPARAGSVL